MIRFNEALDIMLNSVDTVDEEIVSLINSTGRILFEDIYSNLDIPPFNNSAMDGYAIIAEETKFCSIDNPVKLKITGEIQAGIINNDKKITPGNAIEIMTGASMPEGADSVIPVDGCSPNLPPLVELKPVCINAFKKVPEDKITAFPKISFPDVALTPFTSPFSVIISMTDSSTILRFSVLDIIS